MSEKKQPQNTNENAVMGNWIANKIIAPFKKFDETFPEQSQSAQVAFGKAADAGSELAKQGADLGKKMGGKVVEFFQDRGTDIFAWALTIGILAVRGFFNAIDYAAEKVAKPIARAYRNWEPKTPATQNLKNGLDYTGNKISGAYKGYVNFFTQFDYPKSLPALVGLGAAQAAVSLTGIHYMHEAIHTISTGAGTALHYAAVPTLIAVGKGSNLLTLKPGIKLAKTTKDGFFESELYEQKLKPVYMKNFDPWVQLTKKHLQQWDNLVAKNRGKIKERATKAADKIQGHLSSVFGASAKDVRPTKEAAKKLSSAPAREPLQRVEPSKLDGAKITDKWQYVLQSPEKPKDSESASKPDSPAPDTLS